MKTDICANRQGGALSLLLLVVLAWHSRLLCWMSVVTLPEWTMAKRTMHTQRKRSQLIDQGCVLVAQILQAISSVNFLADACSYACFADAPCSFANP